MDLAQQVNPLSRLKLSIVAASLVLGGSLAILVQSPIANASAYNAAIAPISSQSCMTPLAASTNLSPCQPYSGETSPTTAAPHRVSQSHGKTSHLGKTAAPYHVSQSQPCAGETSPLGRTAVKHHVSKSQPHSGKTNKGTTPSYGQGQPTTGESSSALWSKYLPSKTK